MDIYDFFPYLKPVLVCWYSLLECICYVQHVIKLSMLHAHTHTCVGLLEQWMIEGKLDPEDAITQACDLLSAGLDTVRDVYHP